MGEALEDPGAPTARSVRLFDVDWLRVIAIGAIFLYHVGRLFDDLEPWHVKYREVTPWLTYPMALGAQFVMPLFWVLSGMGTRFALGTRPVGDFVRRRATRLLVPLVTVGWWVFGPLQVYIESTTGQQYNAPSFRGSPGEFLPHYVRDGLYGFGGFFAWNGLHLWYLTYLFAFTVSSLPLFGWLRTPAGTRAFSRLAGALARPAALYPLAIPLAAVEALLPRSVPVLAWEEGGWLLGSHWLFLVLGFLLVSDPRLRPATERQRRQSLALATATTAPLALLAPGLGSLAPGSAEFIGFMVLRSANGWWWLLAILGFASAHLDRPRPALAYLGPAVLPFYILHQPLIVAVGYLVRDWAAPIPLAYAVVTLVVLVVSLGVYEVVLRRLAIAGLLFGIEPTRGAPAGTTPPPG